MDNPRREPFYTLEEYYALDKASECRWEYWDGEIVCVSGGTLNHSRISDNIYALLRSGLKPEHGETFTAQAAVTVQSLSGYVYPDVSVVCGEVIIKTIN